MKPMTYTEARANLASVLDTATEDLEEVVITRAGHEPAVVVSLREYEALKETAYLLGSPANARRLYAALEADRSGGGTVRELVDVPADDLPAPTSARSAKVREFALADVTFAAEPVKVAKAVAAKRPRKVAGRKAKAAK
ncbi:type II toxin-antitoxin system Phd/YefM family antitoxin [Nocardia sp. NPDC059764]|uniref:type II toxin-antitoxin system Phd/YefM family antitoxin n=1 Tax=Nocardia sp. NPDC059764 TaxID=3346939 RepID=UPI003664597E